MYVKVIFILGKVADMLTFGKELLTRLTVCCFLLYLFIFLLFPVLL